MDHTTDSTALWGPGLGTAESAGLQAQERAGHCPKVLRLLAGAWAVMPVMKDARAWSTVE